MVWYGIFLVECRKQSQATDGRTDQGLNAHIKYCVTHQTSWKRSTSKIFIVFSHQVRYCSKNASQTDVQLDEDQQFISCLRYLMDVTVFPEYVRVCVDVCGNLKPFVNSWSQWILSSLSYHFDMVAIDTFVSLTLLPHPHNKVSIGSLASSVCASVCVNPVTTNQLHSHPPWYTVCPSVCLFISILRKSGV